MSNILTSYDTIVIFLVEESFDNLLSLESSWNKFLTAVDAELHGPAVTAAATEGEKIKADIHLTNARSVYHLATLFASCFSYSK